MNKRTHVFISKFTIILVSVVIIFGNYIPAMAIVETVPNAPTDVSAVPISPTAIRVTWLDKAINENGFYLSLSTTGTGEQDFESPIQVGSSIELRGEDSGSMDYLVTGLSGNTQYWFRVTAYNGGGTSNAAILQQPVTTPVAAAPADPTDAYAANPTATSLTLYWTDNATNEEGFLISRSTNGTTFTNALSIGPSAQLNGLNTGQVSFTLTGLTPNTPYWFVIRAFTNGGNTISANLKTPTSKYTLLSTPTNLAMTNLTDAAISFSWKRVGTETKYSVGLSPDGTNFTTTAFINVNDNLPDIYSHTFSSLVPNKPYWISVTAMSATNVSAPTKLESIYTLPSKPTGLAASAVGQDTLTLGWTGNGTSYLVENLTLNAVTPVVNGATSLKINNLTCGKSYTFRVKGLNALSQEGVWSDQFSASTATQACGLQPPSPPPAVCPALLPGNLIKVIGAPAIYALDDMLRYRYFADGDVFKSWNADDTYSGKYIPVTSACLSSLSAPDQPPFHVFYRSGSYLVKYVANPNQLYVVQPNHTVVPISASAAAGLYGSVLVQSAKTIGLSEWPFYTLVRTEITTVKAHPGMLVQVNGKMWRVTEDSKLREVAAIGMTANRFKASFVHTVPASAVAGYGTGDAIVEHESALSDRLGQ